MSPCPISCQSLIQGCGLTQIPEFPILFHQNLQFHCSPSESCPFINPFIPSSYARSTVLAPKGETTSEILFMFEVLVCGNLQKTLVVITSGFLSLPEVEITLQADMNPFFILLPPPLSSSLTLLAFLAILTTPSLDSANSITIHGLW